MSRLKKRVSTPAFIRCYMCQQYMGCNVMNKSGERHCRIVDEVIKPESVACKDFVLGGHFHCSKRGIQVALKACYFIRKTKEHNCGTKITTPQNFDIIYSMCHINCKQGQAIQKTYEHFDLVNGITSFMPYVPPKPKSKLKLSKKIKLHRRERS